MGEPSSPQGGSLVRDIADEEAAFFREHGWVKLPGLVSASTAAHLLAELQAVQRADAAVGSRRPPRPQGLDAMWTTCADPQRRSDAVRRFAWSPDVGRAASRLMGGRGVRFFRDSALVKQPTRAGGGRTIWHQDFAYNAIDRPGQLTLWIALVDCPPERGTMRFLDGSHRAGDLGRSLDDPDRDLAVQHPELFAAGTVSPPLHLRPGDATAHDSLVVHSASENTTDEPRWAYTIAVMPADGRYTGRRSALVDFDGLVLGEELDTPQTPLLWPAAPGGVN